MPFTTCDSTFVGTEVFGGRLFDFAAGSVYMNSRGVNDTLPATPPTVFSVLDSTLQLQERDVIPDLICSFKTAARRHET